MNTKIIAGITAIGLTFAGIASTFANDANNTSTSTRPLPPMEGPMFGKMGGGKMGMLLTEAEKTQLASMSETEKQKFFEAKMSEHKAKKTAQDNVIDKLLAGQTLTADEEKIRQEIITERAERKKMHAEREAKMEKYKAIKAKQAAGETLTAEEQALLAEMPTKWGMKMNRERPSQMPSANAQ